MFTAPLEHFWRLLNSETGRSIIGLQNYLKGYNPIPVHHRLEVGTGRTRLWAVECFHHVMFTPKNVEVSIQVKTVCSGPDPLPPVRCLSKILSHPSPVPEKNSWYKKWMGLPSNWCIFCDEALRLIWLYVTKVDALMFFMPWAGQNRIMLGSVRSLVGKVGDDPMRFYNSHLCLSKTSRII